MTGLTLDRLMSAVAGKAAAFRSRVRLQPAGGPSTSVFPLPLLGQDTRSESVTVPVEMSLCGACCSTAYKAKPVEWGWLSRRR